MNTPLIKIFEEIAVMLELKGENQFRIKSFLIAARTLEELDLSNEQLIENLQSEKVKGFGPQLTELALEYLSTGQISLYRDLKSEFPSGLLDLLAISGLGPKKLKILYLELGVFSIDKLEEICRNGTLESVKGFGKKTVANFLEKIQEIRTYHGHIRLPEALQIVQIVSSLAQEVDPSAIVDTTGQIRRFLETISQIHFLVCSPKRTEILGSLEKHFGKCASAADNSYTFIEKHNCEVILEFTHPDLLASCLLLTTGNSKHIDELKRQIDAKSFCLEEYQFKKDNSPLVLNSEKEIFELLDLSYIPPELREGLGEIGRAAKLHEIGESWPDLVNQQDIKGIIHAHTTYSDGTATLRQMAEAAIAKGCQYLGVTDHSQSAAYAGGLKYSDIIRQHNEIDLLNREFHPFKIFKGIESDILADGSLDYPIDVLELFDFVIASLHSHFQMGKEEMMGRLERAIANPYTTILGHPTTRLLLKRGPVELDIHRVLQLAAENQVAVELNSNPMRLDLDWRYHSYARELGVLVPICPDAHSIEGMDDIIYGVGIARKGGLTSKCVPNTWNLEQIADFFQKRER